MTKVKAVGRKTFASLRIRNYRIYAAGQGLSLIGTWMQTVAQGWLVLRLTDDPFPVGVVTALQFLPMLVGGLWGGVIADRFDRRRTLIAAQSALALIATALAVLTATGAIELWMVYALAFAQGATAVVEIPTRQAFVAEMVGPADMANAIGLNSALFNSARIVGPAIAGVTIVALDIWPCFAINAVSFAAVLVSLVRMRVDELHRRAPVPRKGGQVREGIRYIVDDPHRRSVVILMAVIGTFTLNWSVTLPLLARFVFDGDAATYGLFTSVMGLGSLVGALSAAARARPTPQLLTVGAVALGVAMLLVAVAPTHVVVVPVLFVLGLAMMVFLTTANSGLQLSSSDDLRGRVMAVYATVLLGTTPVGAPILGWAASQFGARVPFVIGGVTALAALLAVRTSLVPARSGAPVPLPEAPAAA